MIGLIGTSLMITTNYNSSQSMAVYDLLHSLLGYECLLSYSHCDKMANQESLAAELSLTELTSGRTEYRTPPRAVCVFPCYYLCFVRC
jgi:hypothetical protein